jgi:hypothetical protein
MNTRRAIETTILALIGLLLTVATIDDVSQQVGVNHRLIADLSTWRTVTGHRYHNLSIEQNVEHRGTREVICGNTSPGAPGMRTQICLIMTGPVRVGRRAAAGGYYLPPMLEDRRAGRYGCFGVAVKEHRCEHTG